MNFFWLLTQNLRMKLFSLILALLLFAFVSVENSTPVDVDFRLEYRLDDDMMVVNDAPLVVHTTLRGPWAAFRSFDSMELEPLVVDLQRVGPGTSRHYIDLAQIQAPGGMRVVSVRPSELDIELDRRVVREIEARADITAQPAFGYEVMETRLVPARVRIVGPASKMHTVEYLSTRSIDIAGREDDLNLEVDMRPPPPPLRLLDKRVTAYIEISEQMNQKTFNDVSVTLIGAAPGALMKPNRVNFTLRGPRKILDQVAAESLGPAVDVAAEVAAGFAVAEKSVVFRRILPQRVQLLGPMPRVRVELSLPPNRARKKG